MRWTDWDRTGGKSTLRSIAGEEAGSVEEGGTTDHYIWMVEQRRKIPSEGAQWSCCGELRMVKSSRSWILMECQTKIKY